MAEFILKSRGWGNPLIITRKDSHFSDYEHSTTVPVAPFVSPFIGWHLDAIVSAFDKQHQGLDGSRYGTGNFVILDERSIQDKTCLIVDHISGKTLTLRSDFEMAINVFQGSEVMAWSFDEYPLSSLHKQKKTVTRESFDMARNDTSGAL